VVRRTRVGCGECRGHPESTWISRRSGSRGRTGGSRVGTEPLAAGLRQIADEGEPSSKWTAGRILERIGEKADVKRLRSLSRELRGHIDRRPWAASWLGVRRIVSGWRIRVGLSCALGRERFRDQRSAGDLWRCSATCSPSQECRRPRSSPRRPVAGFGSGSGGQLPHQTVYFLRRVIEPSYSDDLSPGYVNQDTELVWLDPELITSRSVRCRTMLRGLGTDPPSHAVLSMAIEYRGRFALDFSYEDWAASYRESLHAQYLEVMERADRVCVGRRKVRGRDGDIARDPRHGPIA